MNTILALCLKDLRLLVRDKGAFFFVFIFPIMYSVFFGAIMASMGTEENSLSVIVVDEDRTDSSEAFLKTLEGSPSLEVRRVSARPDAEGLVRGGKAAAYVVVPAGFGETRKRPFWGDPPRLEVGVDPSRKAEAGMLQGLLTRFVFQGLQETLQDPKLLQGTIHDAIQSLQSADSSDMEPITKATLLTFLPALERFIGQMPAGVAGASGGFQEPTIEFHDVTRKRSGPRNPYEISCPQGVIWGILSCTAGFAISLVSERVKGTLVRLRTAPISQIHILGGKAAACFAMAVLLGAVMLGLFAAIFGVRVHSLALFVTALLSVAVCFSGLMMLLSVLGRTEQGAGGAGWAILMVFAMLGGGMIPLAFMPSAMQSLSNISPVKWSILAMEGAIWRGFSYGDMALPCGVLLAVGGVSFVIGIRSFRWSE